MDQQPETQTHSSSDGPSVAAVQSGTLRRDALGVSSIVFFVVAAAAPLTGVVASFPLIIGQGNGIGIAGSFLTAAIILLLFSVGYTTMSRYITNAGAFYTYVAQGLGRAFGLGAATLAIFAYSAIQMGLYGAFGFFAGQTLSNRFGISLPWWVYAFVSMAVCLAIGVRGIDIGAKVLAILLTAETSIILVLDGAILFSGGANGFSNGFSLAPFSPVETFSGAIGVGLIFAHVSYVGFEATAIYSEEARDPTRTVPRATYLAVTLMGVFYAGTAWLIVNAFGPLAAVARAKADPGTFIYAASTRYVGQVSTDIMYFLIISSIFAAIIAFHNTLTRYLFALGRQGLLWSKLGHTHSTRQSPYVASRVQTVSAFIAVGVFALLGRDPYSELFAWATGVGALGVILLQTTASVAIFVFFRRRDVDKRIWHTWLAPVLGTAGLLMLFFFGLKNFNDLTGSSGSLAVILLVLIVASGLTGILWALWMRRTAPQRYERVGTLLQSDEEESLSTDNQEVS